MTQQTPIPIYIDVTETLALDLRTGIQRVVRGITCEPLVGDGRYSIEPVIAVAGRFRRLSDAGRRRVLKPDPEVARHERPGQPTLQGTIAKLLLAPFPALIQRLKRRRNASALDRRLDGLWAGRALNFKPGDRVVLADTYILSGASFAGRRAQKQGAKLIALTYDLIPIRYGELLSESMVEHFRAAVPPTMDVADGVLTISDWCVEDLREFGVTRPLGRFYLGYDLAGAAEPASVDDVRWPPNLWSSDRPLFLMVGTMAQHKGYMVAIDAFERLWAEGVDARLLVIGRPGWDEALMARFRDSPELGHRLFVLHGMPDSILETALQRATAVVQGSAVEGFGLPVIEALARGTPVIASDIPVFREVAGDAAMFYSQSDSVALSNALQKMMRERDEWVARARQFRWIDWPTARTKFAQEVERLARVGGE